MISVNEPSRRPRGGFDRPGLTGRSRAAMTWVPQSHCCLRRWQSGLQQAPCSGEGRGLLERALNFSSFEEGLAPSTMWVIVDDVLMAAAWVFIPLVLVLALASILSQFVQVGWLFTLSPLKPRASRINPVDGTKRLMGSSGAVRVTLDLLKIGAVLLVAVLTMLQYASGLLTLPYLDLPTGMEQVGMCLLDLALRVGRRSAPAWFRGSCLATLEIQAGPEDDQAAGQGRVAGCRGRSRIPSSSQAAGIAGCRSEGTWMPVPESGFSWLHQDPWRYSSSMIEPVPPARWCLPGAGGMLPGGCSRKRRTHRHPIIETGSLASELHEQVANGERVPEHLFRGVAEVLAGVYRDSGSGTP